MTVINSIRNSISVTFLVLLLSLPTMVFGNPNATVNDIAITETPGMTFYRPTQFYGGQMPYPEIPEIEYINTGEHEQLDGLAKFLESRGVALSLGSNPNRDSAFERIRK